jgi:hypothetical protein
MGVLQRAVAGVAASGGEILRVVVVVSAFQLAVVADVALSAEVRVPLVQQREQQRVAALVGFGVDAQLVKRDWPGASFQHKAEARTVR